MVKEPVYIAPCEKCGEPEPSIKYALSAKFCHRIHEAAYPAEHFDVSCLRCGYKWWTFIEGDSHPAGDSQ